MEFLYNSKQMQTADAGTITKTGIPPMVLMERAALSVVDEMKKSGADLSRTLVICGSGNNGGDGFAIARILSEERNPRISVTLAFVGKDSSMTDQTALQRQICENIGLKICSSFAEKQYTVIVDAMFGIGLSRDIEGRYAEVIDWVNSQDSYIVSVDIPSGISADSGKVMGRAVKADLTVTMQSRKTGQILYPGFEYCGILKCRNIGVRTEEFASTNVFTYNREDLKKIPARIPYSNKGTYGKVLIIAGSEGMCGAAILSARAAYRTGCGLVRVFTPECNRAVIQSALPEAVVTACDAPLSDMLAWADAVAVGPGIGMSDKADEILSYVIRNNEKPLVIDADALNLISRNPGYLSQIRENTIITPHVLEMMRLMGAAGKEKVTDDLIASARTFAAAHGLICVLKDARTIVSDSERVYLNTSGNDGMATAGAGDVLTGIICSLLAQKMDPFSAASLGVYLHGCAGDEAKKRLGGYAMMASDICDCAGEVLKERISIDGKK